MIRNDRCSILMIFRAMMGKALLLFVLSFTLLILPTSVSANAVSQPTQQPKEQPTQQPKEQLTQQPKEQSAKQPKDQSGNQSLNQNIEENEVIRLGYFSYQHYMMGASEDEPKSGFAYELLCDVATVNNWEYEYVYGDFNDLYQMLLKGEIDILPCLVYTEERAQNHFFSDEEIYEEKYYISALTERAAETKKISDLDGMRISTVADSYQTVVLEEWAKENGISVNLVFTDSFDESWDLVKEGKADYILNIDSAANDSGFVSLFEVGSGSTRFAVSSQRKDVVEKLNSAIDTIYEINPFTISHLKEKYLSATLSSYQLSADEIEWLKGRDSIRIGGYADNRPYTYFDRNRTPAGVYPDVIKEMFARLNIEKNIEWVLYDTEEEMSNALKAGEVDLICPCYCDHFFAEDNDIIISEKLQSTNMGILFADKKNDIDVQKIAIPDSLLIRNYVKSVYPDAQLISYNMLDDCVDAVSSGKADATIAHVSLLQNETLYDSHNFDLKTLVVGCPIAFASRPQDGMLICIIDRGIHLISESELQALEMEHSPKNNYELWNYIKKNKWSIVVLILAVLALMLYAANRSSTSAKLKKNLDEITKQKRIIEENEQKLVEAEANANAASKAKSVFLFNMSHDIRTPMNAILGYSDRMLKHIDDKDIVADSAEKIKSSGGYLLDLINDVLDMARIESDQITLDEEIHDIREKAFLLCDVFDVTMKNKNLTFNVDFDDIQDTVVWYDGPKMRQIMLNLISNAAKYTPEGGTITYTIRQASTEREGYASYEIIISDTGIGMSEEFIGRIFELFSRSDDSITKETQGTGLGMSIVKKLVDLMGGTIDIKSEVGKGSVITLRFDLRKATEEERRCYLETQSPVEVHDEIKDIKILVVDDNALNREILIEILQDEGCIVADVAENGQMAVEKVAASTPGDIDLILMDVQMPIMDGYEATRRIRAIENEVLANIPIIAMTANAFEKDRRDALAAGMNEHLTKPVDIKKLKSTLAKIEK